MAISLGIAEVGEAPRAAIFSLAIGPGEMAAMGLDGPGHPETGPFDRVRRLRTLQRFATEQPAVARRISDLLDLRFTDTLLYIRSLDDQTVTLVARAWLESPEPEALPGLIWALCTDPRQVARCTGVRLAHQAAWLGCQTLFHQQPHPTNP
jgi:hypothetical protein